MPELSNARNKGTQALVRLLRHLSPVGRRLFAEYAGTSRSHLNNVTSSGKTVGPDLACRLEAAADRVRDVDRRVPRLRREDLCPACGRCDLARVARKAQQQQRGSVSDEA